MLHEYDYIIASTVYRIVAVCCWLHASIEGDVVLDTLQHTFCCLDKSRNDVTSFFGFVGNGDREAGLMKKSIDAAQSSGQVIRTAILVRSVYLYLHMCDLRIR